MMRDRNRKVRVRVPPDGARVDANGDVLASAGSPNGVRRQR